MYIYERYSIVKRYLRACDDDANERVVIGAGSLYGVVEPPGEVQLGVLSRSHCGEEGTTACDWPIVVTRHESTGSRWLCWLLVALVYSHMFVFGEYIKYNI